MNTELFEKATRLNETLVEQFGKAAEMQMNVVCCHQHHNAIGSFKNFTVADCGCLADAAQTAYVELGVSRLPPWQPGFLVMQKGKLIPYNKHGHYGLESS